MPPLARRTMLLASWLWLEARSFTFFVRLLYPYYEIVSLVQ